MSVATNFWKVDRVMTINDLAEIRMKESVANLCHEQWSKWMRYMLSKCLQTNEGAYIIPKLAVDRWERQMNTPYLDLPEDEKESDRKEADRFIALMLSYEVPK